MADIVRVDGLRELEAKLKAIGEEYGAKAALSPIRTALRKAGKKIQQSAQSRVHVDSGTLKQNIIVTAERKPADGTIAMKVTVRAKAKAYKSNSRTVRLGKIGAFYQHYGPLFYARMLEFGFHDAKGVMHIYPFMRPAFEENKSALPAQIRDDLAAAIDKTVARLSK